MTWRQDDEKNFCSDFGLKLSASETACHVAQLSRYWPFAVGHHMPRGTNITRSYSLHFNAFLQLCIYDLNEDKCCHSVKTIKACPGKGQNLGKLIPLAYDKFSVKVWDIETKKEVHNLTGPDDHQVTKNFNVLISLSCWNPITRS